MSTSLHADEAHMRLLLRRSNRPHYPEDIHAGERHREIEFLVVDVATPGSPDGNAVPLAVGVGVEIACVVGMELRMMVISKIAKRTIGSQEGGEGGRRRRR